MANVSAHIGFWIDHTHGPVNGATLTVPIKWGNYLIAFFTTLVSWAGISAWSTISYWIHQLRAGKKGKDSLDVQLQIHLRNSSSPANTINEMLKLGIAWRTTGIHARRRILSIMLAAMIAWSLFVTSGILVAYVATHNYDAIFVLAKPDICGTTVIYGNTSRGSDLTNDKYKNGSKAALAYVDNWYHGDSSISNAGSLFRSLTLPYNISTNEPCPFGGKTHCLGINNTKGGAIAMDSGPLDSILHLGINTPKSDRVTYRRRVTCAPVALHNFTSPIATYPNNNQSYLDILIGPVYNVSNYTFEWLVSAEFVSGYDLRYVF
jgi:hypothetical protein